MAWCKACCRCLGTAQPEVDVAAQPAVEAEAQPDADAAAQQHAAPDPSPTVASGHFTTTEALLATVEDGSVGPLSGRYLMGLAEGGGLLQRRQDLPEEAFFVPSKELLAKVGSESKKYFFLALSYRWLTASHPDPSRFHLTIVSHVVREYLKWHGTDGIVDVGIFWDFGSLHQKPRINNEEALFKEGLRASNRWYGSSESVVLLQSHVPPAFHGAPYDESGWCFVEAAISSAIKEGDCRLDLGKLEIDGRGHVITKGDWYMGIQNVCQKNRLPPLLPETVRKLLEKEKTFTDKGDVPSVAGLYQRFFDDVSSSVEELGFDHCGWTKHHMSDFAKALPMFQKLRILNLSYNDLHHDGTEVLASALKGHPSMTVLRLFFNKIGDHGASALAEALKANKSITVLDLHSNNIGDDGATALAEALKANTSITKLSLYNNKIGDDGATSLAEALQANTSITTLYLQDNKIGDDGASALAVALKANKSITVLYLNENNIGDDGATALAVALKASTSITTLSLYGNKIGDDGASALAVALKANTSITTLDLKKNKIGDDGASALAEALKENKTLKILSLPLNGIGEEGRAALRKAQAANRDVNISI